MSFYNKLNVFFQSVSISVKEYGLENTILSIYEDIFNKHKKIFLSAVDFMIPLNGTVTAGQFIIISRLLDYERIIDGQGPIWDKKFSELQKKM